MVSVDHNGRQLAIYCQIKTLNGQLILFCTDILYSSKSIKARLRKIKQFLACFAVTGMKKNAYMSQIWPLLAPDIAWIVETTVLTKS
jgi:hypothetical protein